MLELTFSNLIGCLMISHEILTQKLHKRASVLQWILGKFGFSQKCILNDTSKSRNEERYLHVVANRAHKHASAVNTA